MNFEPKTEREFMLLLVEQVRHIRHEMDECKLDFEGRLQTLEGAIDSLNSGNDLAEQKEIWLEEVHQKKIDALNTKNKKEITRLDIKNKKTKNWQMFVSIFGTALLTLAGIYWYLSK